MKWLLLSYDTQYGLQEGTGKTVRDFQGKDNELGREEEKENRASALFYVNCVEFSKTHTQ